MVKDYSPDLAMSIKVVSALMSELELKFCEAQGEEKALIFSVGAYSVLTCSVSLRGEEGFVLDPKAPIQFIDSGKNHVKHRHVIVPL